MRLPSRLLRRVRQLKNRRKRPEPDGQLREFVYLDEVSVYSILASRRGGIATEFTESQTASLNSGVGAALGVSGTTLNAKTHASQTQGSQVLRKAIIQTSFKELYDIERDGLALRPRHGCRVPRLSCVADLEGQLDSLSRDGWIVDPSAVSRGALLEVQVDLEAEPIFQLITVSATIREIIEGNPQAFDYGITQQFAETQAVTQALESMLVGLVPIRGHLIDYQCMNIGGRDLLVHRSVLDQVLSSAQPEAVPVFVVGVTQRDLFWKDIRRVLFSEAPYTVFCRLAVSGLTDKWRPVKVADLLGGISPQFDDLIREASEQARLTMRKSASASARAGARNTSSGEQVIRQYADLLVSHHDASLERDSIDELTQGVPREDGWLDSVDGRRQVFAEVTRRLDAKLGVETSGDAAYSLRPTARNWAGMDRTSVPHASGGRDPDRVATARAEKFLDAEIVAIYW